jgi:hypothetical protein
MCRKQVYHVLTLNFFALFLFSSFFLGSDLCWCCFAWDDTSSAHTHTTHMDVNENMLLGGN